VTILPSNKMIWVKTLGVLSLCFILSWQMLLGSGGPCYSFQVVSLTGLLFFSLKTKRFFWLLVFPFCSIFSVYFPIGLHYGMPEKGHIASLIATDATESFGFIESIPLWQWCVPFLLIGGLIFIKKLAAHVDSKVYCKEIFLAFSIIFLISLLSIFGWESARYDTAEFIRLTPWWKCSLFLVFFLFPAYQIFAKKPSASTSKLPLFFSLVALLLAYTCRDFRPIYNGIKGTIVVFNENKKMRSLIQSNDWVITGNSQKYKIYLLIIGESVRRDYMHAYGYPEKNTDFMDSVNGIVFDGFISEGDETIPSLRRALTHSRPSGDSVNYSLNIIGLANKAGFATSWFSNQGFANSADTPVSAIGSLAHTKRWIRVGYSHTYSDRDLLPLLKSEIQRPEDRPKFIVLHINGSHPGVCGPVNPATYEAKLGDPYYKEAFCYVENIRLTDKLLEDAYEILKNNGQPFSMLYFADHGLSHSEIAGQLVIKHAKPANHSRDIPLFRTSSDDQSHTVVKGRRFGDSLTEGIAHWIGIRTKQIPNPKDLFSSTDDPDTRGHENLMKQRRDDPAINILEHMAKENGDTKQASPHTP